MQCCETKEQGLLVKIQRAVSELYTLLQIVAERNVEIARLRSPEEHAITLPTGRTGESEQNGSLRMSGRLGSHCVVPLG